MDAEAFQRPDSQGENQYETKRMAELSFLPVNCKKIEPSTQNLIPEEPSNAEVEKSH